MNSPALEETGTPISETPVFYLHLQDTLAAGNRVWIRGQLSGSGVVRNGSSDGRSWWKPWRKEEQASL